MRKERVNSIKEILQKLVKKQKFTKKLDEVEVINQLEKIIGNNLNKYIISKYFRDGKIYLQLSSSVLRNELLYQKEELISKINQEIGKKLVKDIVLK